MTSSFERSHETASATVDDVADVLLRFGVSMLRAGNSAARTRQWMEVMARKLGFDAMAVGITFDSIVVSALSSGKWVTAMREIGPSGVNAGRIGALERLAKAEAIHSPRELTVKLDEIESAAPPYSRTQIVAAIALASGGFAFLNGGAAPEMIAAGIGGGIGHWLRSWLSRRSLNQYGVAALSAIAASGAYVLSAMLAARFGVVFARYPIGFIASVLFLIPGVPLIAALFDLLQQQTVAAVSRFAYGAMLLLSVALGLSIVLALTGIDLSRPPPLELSYPLKLLLRSVASFVAACAFAMLFNASMRTVLAAGVLALVVNSLRLVLIDFDVMLAPAAFFSALAIGVVALQADQRFGVPRLALMAAPIVIMIPGMYAFEMIVMFNRGQMLEALQATAFCGFVIGGLAMGLAAARLFSRD